MIINLGAGNLQFCIIWLLALRRIWVLSILQRSICLREQLDSRRIAWDATYSWGVVRLTEKNFKFPLRTFQMARKEIIEANDNKKWTFSREASAKHTCYNAYSPRSPMITVSETVGTHSPPRKNPTSTVSCVFIHHHGQLELPTSCDPEQLQTLRCYIFCSCCAAKVSSKVQKKYKGYTWIENRQQRDGLRSLSILA